MLVGEEREHQSTWRKTSRSKERTNNKLNQHVMPGLGIKPGTHGWEVSTDTTAPVLLPRTFPPGLQVGVRFSYLAASNTI